MQTDLVHPDRSPKGLFSFKCTGVNVFNHPFQNLCQSMASVDGSRSLYSTSDEAPDNLCDPCRFGGIQNNGSHYCKTCTEYLCINCKESHGRFKATRNHTIVSSTDLASDGQKALQFMVLCACDQSCEVAIYCESHDEVVCMTCKSVKHRKCNVITLREKGSTYKISDIQTIIQNVHSLEKEIKQFQQDRDSATERIESIIETSREKIKSLRKDFNIFMDTLENDMLSELKEKATKMRFDVEQHIPTCTDTLKSLDDDLKMLDDASKCSNAEMMFAADVKVSKRLTELRSMMNDFQDEVKAPLIDFEGNQKLLNLKHEVQALGTLRVSESQKTKTEPVNFLNMKLQNSREVQIKLPNDKNVPFITGCTFMVDGQLLLCDCNNNTIKLLNSTFDITGNLDLDSRPWDISAVDSTRAVVTFPNLKQLKFIDIVPALKADKQIQLDKYCWGVDVARDKIYVTCHDNPGNAEIRVFDKNGTFIRKVPDDYNTLSSLRYPYYIAVSKTSSKIYLSDFSPYVVRCISVDGSLVFNYQHDDLRYPRTVLLNEEGNILVCGECSYNIHVVTSTGQQHSVLYTVQGRRNNNCVSLAYRPTDRTLVIGLKDNCLLVLQLTKCD